MSSRRRASGFTLIEAMIVVAIVGVLAVLATVGYRRWTRGTYVAEATDMLGNIRTAENSFFAENGGYFNVTGTAASPQRGAGNSYPATHPGAFVSDWGGPCAACTGNPNAWQQLGIQASGPVHFGYSCMAGDGVKVQASIIGAPTVNGVALNYASLQNPAQPWYFIEADANLSGDNTNFTHVYAMSGASTNSTNKIWVDGESN
jgi:prepilin-type N-terminal cleavage/methylation domain-containing protein